MSLWCVVISHLQPIADIYRKCSFFLNSTRYLHAFLWKKMECTYLEHDRLIIDHRNILKPGLQVEPVEDRDPPDSHAWSRVYSQSVVPAFLLAIIVYFCSGLGSSATDPRRIAAAAILPPSACVQYSPRNLTHGL